MDNALPPGALPPRLAAVLADPPRDFSPTAIWWWSGEPLRRERLRWQLERFAAGGVYQLVVLNLAPSGPMFDSDADDPPFFSEPWWELLEQVCDDAEEIGVRLWFYDQLGFSGAAIQAGLVREEPRFAGQWPAKDGSVELRGFDYLSRDACAVLIDRVHGEFERRLGKRLGGVIAGSFQDELPTIPTWSAAFPAEFERRRGYDLAPLRHLLWEDAPDAGRVRRDYQRTRAELAEEAFFRPLAAWHERHGLLQGCDQQDPARAGDPAAGVRLYADYARTHRHVSAPGSDHHGDARIHSSLAHLHGHPRTWIEAFHSSGWGGTLEETFDWLLPWLRAGANLYNPHAVYYSTKGGWWEWAPPATDWRQPYWIHHRVFATAVTRLCAALSLGRHACDIAVLLPTATVQSAVSPDGDSAGAERARRVYADLVGDMTWFRAVPGTLDRLGLDADVIDDDSVQRARPRGGRLEVADESYAVVLLPACTVLDAETERRLTEFAAVGGLVVAVGERPPAGALRDHARYAATPDDLALLLATLRRVEAPVPPLVREVEGTTLVFLQAAFPGASRVTARRPDDRGVDLGWAEAEVDFDAGRYAESMPVRVRDVSGPPLLADAFTGELRELPYEDDGEGGVRLTVPFDGGPAALLVFGAGGAERPGGGREPEGSGEQHRLDGPWRFDLLPTLDDTWGDFGPPSATPLQRWAVEHRVDGEAEWRPVHATFGPHGVWRAGEGVWRPATYSTSRGLHKDRIHRQALGPKGHVPEEFLDFGEARPGDTVTFRTELTIPAPGGFLRIGAPAAKHATLDGRRVALHDQGYLAFSTEPLTPGTALLELRLAPDEPVWLRGHLSVVTERRRTPEWITAEPGRAVFTTTVEPSAAPLQVAAVPACRVLVDGVEVGRQGGFDPYEEEAKPRAARYDLTPQLRSGGNELAIEVADGAGGVLIDGCAVSGAEWQVRTEDGERRPVRTRRAQFRDPAALHLPRRPHPLPEAAWLEGRQDGSVLPAVLAAPGTAGRSERLRFTVPPGATAMRVPVHGQATLLLDGEVRAQGLGPLHLDLEPDRGVREAELRVTTDRGHSGGAMLTGPVEFTPGPGPIALGDWEAAGLAEYSGGVRYRTAVTVDAVTHSAPRSALLDLGRVRGTAEVRVNSVPCGIRVCSPYRFDITPGLRPGRNDVEIDVYGTLAPYLDAVSPTHFVFPGQRTTGLFGPVHLRIGVRP